MTELNPTNNSNENYWRRKLDAFMHDNLSKAIDVKAHEERAFRLRAADMIQPDERFDKNSDFWAAAADRLPFPKASELKAPFDGALNAFKHPFAEGISYETNLRKGADAIDGIAQDNRIHLDLGNPKIDFIARWRFWRLWTQSREPATAFFPADTRIPDHSIWNHLGLTSAFQGCFGTNEKADQPAIVLFSIGPVQPMIAAARRIGDLWSGSYLLSYLASVGLAKIAKRFGPDHVLFPSTWGQPLVDLQLKSLYQEAKVSIKSESTLWDLLWRGEDKNVRQRYLMPSLPNRFLALIPSSEAESTCMEVEAVIKGKLREIGESVDELIGPKISKTDHISYHPERICSQLGQCLEIHWQSLTLPNTFEEAEGWAVNFLPSGEDSSEHHAVSALRQLKRMWDKMPEQHRTNYGLKTPSSSWPVSFSLLSWALDSVKQTRIFDAWSQSDSSWQYGIEQNKDDLNGRDETVLSIPEDISIIEKFCREIRSSLATFRPNEKLGALTLVKRLWHLAYLTPQYGFREEDFRMPDTHQLSMHRYEGQEEPQDEVSDLKGGYIAVLALDGDEMGKWVSGEKTPKIGSLLAKDALGYFEAHAPEFLDMRRPLNPSFHLQFSEALANFGLYTVRRIVEYHSGRLIYAGGDDVLAILPSDTALECAECLRRAFKGELDRKYSSDSELFNLENQQSGFLRLSEGDSDRDLDPVNYDVMLPGPSMEVSVGLAIGHSVSPLQDLVRAAQAAEKTAKSEYGRAALAISVFKRSGEIQHWGCKWFAPHKEKHPGLDLLQFLISSMKNKELEARFPHKLLARIDPYLGGAFQGTPTYSKEDSNFNANVSSILQAEVEDILSRSSSKKDCSEILEEKFSEYFGVLFSSEPQKGESSEFQPIANKLDHLSGLLRTAAWIARNPN